MKTQTENKMENLKTAIYQMIEFYSKKDLFNIEFSDDKKCLYISNTKSFTGIKISKNMQIAERENVYEITRKNAYITIWKTCNQVHTHLM